MSKPKRSHLPVDHVLDVYDTHLHLARTKRELRAAQKLVGTKISSANCGSVTWLEHITPGGHYSQHLVIWVDVAYAVSPAELINTCAHEATHAAGRILEHTNELPAIGAEQTAYLVGWLTEWIWNHCQLT